MNKDIVKLATSILAANFNRLGEQRSKERRVTDVLFVRSTVDRFAVEIAF